MSSRATTRPRKARTTSAPTAARSSYEFRTYRFRAHSMFDPELYRDKAEVEEWRKRDPIHDLQRAMPA